jgi:hypothetical protein
VLLDIDEELPVTLADDIIERGLDDKDDKLYGLLMRKLLQETRAHPGLRSVHELMAERLAMYYVMQRRWDRHLRQGLPVDMKMYEKFASLFTRQAEGLFRESRSVDYDEAFRRSFVQSVMTAVAIVLRQEIEDDPLREAVKGKVVEKLRELLT